MARTDSSREMTLFEMWNHRKERGELLQRANQLRLGPSQLTQLLGDSGVRAALQNTRTASLLPPVGTEVFRRLTPASLAQIQQGLDAREEEKNKEVAKDDPPKPTRDLEAGKPLPFIYRDPPPELLNTALQELDPFYQSQKTFIVIGRGNIIHRFNAESSCFLLSPFSPLRTFAIKILIHSVFRFFIMATILTNCVFMTMINPPAWFKTLDHVFTAVYTFEAVIKVASRGFCLGKFSFLRDPWNWLDVLVILSACVEEFVYLGISPIFRILKIIPLIPGLKKTVRDLAQSVKRLAGVIGLMVFCLIFFALIGQQLFMGALMNKCVMWTLATNSGNTEFDFNEFKINQSNHYYLPGECYALRCGNSSDAGRCPEGFTCLRAGSNPNYGYTSFDSFGWSLLSMIRLMSKDFWENLVHLLLRAAGKFAVILFVVLVFPGCFCVLSLAVAVVAMACSEAGVSEATDREEEFSRIVAVLKRREEEEDGREACRAALSEDQENNMEGVDEKQRTCPPCWFVFANFLLKWNCCGCWRWLKQRLYAFVTNPFFDLGIVVCIVLNTVFMSLDHYPMTEKFWQILVEANLVFSAIFAAEMVLKLVAMDPYGYFQVGWNIFDSILVVLSLLELFFVVDCPFLILRVLRLARWWPSLHMLMKVVWRSLSALRYLTLLLFITIFLFSVVGMEMFHDGYGRNFCKISLDRQLPRRHMADFFHAVLVVIQAVGGTWVEAMWDCMEVSGETTCLLFFMMLLPIANLLVLYLFLTLLLSSFDHPASPEEKEKNNLHIALNRIRSAVRTLLGKKTPINPEHTAVDSKDHLALTVVTSDQTGSKVKTLTIANTAKMPEKEQEKKKHPEDDDRGNRPEDCCSDKCLRCCPFLDIDTSRGSGRIWSNFRRACFCIVRHKCFDNFIILIILLSSATLVFEDIHLHHRPVLQTVVQRVEQVTTILFLMEMLLKWIAFGLKKYFSNGWCWLDFLVLQVSLVSQAAAMIGYTDLERVSLRALGPWRALSRFQGPKVVVQTLVRSVSSVFSVLPVVLVVWLIFCVCGMDFFGGRFYFCFNETSGEIFSRNMVNNKSECFDLVMQNYSEVLWKNQKLNYDNVGSGFLSLLHLAASAYSPNIINSAVDARMVESQPIYESNPYMHLYFICFFIFGCFFTFILFIGVIINRLQSDKSAGIPIFMTAEEQKVMKRLVMKPQKPVPRPQNQFQARLFDLVTLRWFGVFMATVICLNMVVLMMETDDQSMEMEIILYWFHFLFIILFLVEFILKIVGLRRHYFTDGWNILDFVVLIVSIMGIFLSDIMWIYSLPVPLFLVLRMLRVLRVLSIFRYAQGTRKLLLSLVMSFPALFNIGIVLVIITFSSSVFGMLTFGFVKREAMIDDIFNFETFVSSVLCVFTISTSASWGGLLRPLLNWPPDCDPLMEHPGFPVIGNCSYPPLAIAFFVSHLFLCFLLLVHLYIAVVMETLGSDDDEQLSEDDLQMFHNTWREFDPEASQVIQYSQLSDFCDALQDPLRIPKPNSVRLIHMDLPLLPGDRIRCVDVLLALASQVVGDSEKMNALKAKMEERFNPSKVSCEPISSTLQRKQEVVAATVIQKAYRKHVLQDGDAQETTGVSVDAGGH
ncbi:sodium channel protein type 4 subunit alpha B isoform X1 [Perca flavescens]|uniref:sodium channel protein type 4 subunit alpha B isoform X1 n=1 Tax=Perca flavescens TaxID=8167 RepID=UPI00106EAA0F|nr:sodium channel protein type 4 subunit alpha B-like isoform X1 [Perca flavescens]